MLWLYLRVPRLPSPFSKHCCHCWPLLLWPWPLRSLLQCCGRPIFSSGSETAACSFLPLLAVSFGAVALSSGSETAISLFQNTAATAGPCCCGRGRCGPCCSAVAAQSFLRVPRLPPAPSIACMAPSKPPSSGSETAISFFKTLLPLLAPAAVAVAAAVPAALPAVAVAAAVPCYGRTAVAAQSFLRVPRLPPAPLKTSDPSLQLPSTASCVFGAVALSSGSETSISFFKTLLPLLAPAAVAVAAAVPAALAAVAVAAAVPCYGRTAAVLWPPNLFFGFRDCRLPPSKPPTLRCSFLPLLAVSFGAVALSSGSETAISFFKTLLPLLAPAAVAVAAAVPAAVLWPPNRFFGFRDCRLPPQSPGPFKTSIFGFRDCHLLFQNIAATARPCCCGCGRCGPCCPSCCGRGRCGPLLWPHCCSAVAAQSFLRVPRLPPAPLKTSDPSLQLPSTASCVFWCCGSIFGFRDFHLLFQNIAATAGPCCCGRGRCGPCCPSCCGRGRCGPLLWPHCCSAVAAQSFLRVPRLPPAPLKTSDPSLQLPSTASCVFWCCGSIFGFRDCHLLFQNIAATAGPGAFLLWPWPLRSPAMAAKLQCCGRPIFSSGSETAACPPQNLRPSLQLPSTASCVFWCCGSIFGFRDFHLLFQNIAATAGPCCCGRGRWTAISFFKTLLPLLAPAAVAVAAAVPAAVLWPPNLFFGFRDCRLQLPSIAKDIQSDNRTCCTSRLCCYPVMHVARATVSKAPTEPAKAAEIWNPH